MTKERKMELLAEILDVDVHELKPDDTLADMDAWDSLAILSFISMMDEEFGKELKGSIVRDLVSVQDALDLMQE